MAAYHSVVERDTLLLVDGHSLVYRAFFAMPALTNSRGEVTNAAYGFTSMLLKALGDHRPTHAARRPDPPVPLVPRGRPGPQHPDHRGADVRG
jgi:hypothetical protein